MGTSIRNGVVSPQIWARKRKEKVIELLDYLQPARVEYAENIFAGEKYLTQTGEKTKDYSYIRLVISDGIGKQRKSARYNLDVDTLAALRRQCEPSVNYNRDFHYEEVKKNDRNGQVTNRKVTIHYSYYRTKNGKPLLDKEGNKQIAEYPWYVGINESIGTINPKNPQKPNYHTNIQAFILLTSMEYQSMLDSACRYIDVFTMTFAPNLVREKRKMIEKERQEYLKKKEQKQQQQEVKN